MTVIITGPISVGSDLLEPCPSYLESFAESACWGPRVKAPWIAKERRREAKNRKGRL